MSASAHMFVDTYLKDLRLPAIARNYRSLAREAAEQNKTLEEYLAAVHEVEVNQRRDNKLKAD